MFQAFMRHIFAFLVLARSGKLSFMVATDKGWSVIIIIIYTVLHTGLPGNHQSQSQDQDQDQNQDQGPE